ncbi:hypothetical protein [Roseinatronobacter thiooxidans]|nr:hypothetical protein [Roseinatronobacter thiooxidans]
MTTYQMRLPRGPHEDGLAAVAAHLCGVERHLHSAHARLHRAAGGDAGALRVGKNDLKRRFLTEHGITGRQYNSLLRGLEGRYASLQELAKARIETTERRRRSLVKKITARGRNPLPTQSEYRRHVWRQWARVRKDLLACDSQNKGRHTAGAALSASSYCPPGREGGDVRLRKQHAACPVRSRPDQGNQRALLTPGYDCIPYL